MGLSNPAAPGEAPSAAPPERFDEAAAYAREQAEANAANSGTGTTGTAPTTAGPAVGNTAPAAAATAPAAASTAGHTTAPTPQPQPAHAAGQHQAGVPPQPPNGGQWANPGNPTQPVQGVPVRGPAATPQPQHVIIGYMLVTPQEDCSCDLRLEGWLVVLILLLTVPCVAFLPCLIPDCFQPYQVPIYGPPGSYPVPIATPYYG